MKKIIFDEKLRTRVAWQDREHEELIKRVNALSDAAYRGEGRDEVAGLLKFLDDYVVVHFHNEERAMHSSNYPDALSHMREHTAFIDELGRFRAGLEQEGASAGLAGDIRQKIILWLCGHIGDPDKKLGAFLVRGTVSG